MRAILADTMPIEHPQWRAAIASYGPDPNPASRYSFIAILAWCGCAAATAIVSNTLLNAGSSSRSRKHTE